MTGKGHNSSTELKEIFAAARPLVEQWLDVGEQIGALRDAATAKGIDWSQLKALLKAQIQDERDETGEGKRVKRIVEKAEFASAYADMLGLANMNEKKYFAAPLEALKQRSAERLSESMADNKVFSAEMLKDGLITPEAHAENVRLSDAVANKLGVGAIDPGDIPDFLRRKAN